MGLHYQLPIWVDTSRLLAITDMLTDRQTDSIDTTRQYLCAYLKMCSLLQICVQYCIVVAYVVEIKLNSIQFNSTQVHHLLTLLSRGYVLQHIHQERRLRRRTKNSTILIMDMIMIMMNRTRKKMTSCVIDI